MTIKIGCSGFQEARSKYYEEFSLIEIQQTFFQPPPVGTALKWRSQASPQFEFSVKAWQLITHEPVANGYRNLRERLPARALANCGHFKPSKMVFEAWRKTEAVAEALQAKIIIFQTPKTFRPSPQNFRNFKNFFRRINRRKFTMVWEPGCKWPQDKINELCHEFNLVYTSNPEYSPIISLGPIRYFRLRGKQGYRSRYNDEDFQRYLRFENNDKTSYFILNNASMLFDARNFVTYLQNHPVIEDPSTEVQPVSDIQATTENDSVECETCSRKDKKLIEVSSDEIADLTREDHSAANGNGKKPLEVEPESDDSEAAVEEEAIK